jgi:hypothetical protein
VTRIFESTDRSIVTRCLDKITGRFHFGAHGTSRELELTELVNRGAPKLTRRRRAKIDFDRGNISEEQECVSSKQLCEQRRGSILVDYRLNALQMSITVSDDWNAAPAATDHPDAGVQQIGDGENSTSSFGLGEGTTRRHEVPSRRTSQPRSSASCSACRSA